MATGMPLVAHTTNREIYDITIAQRVHPMLLGRESGLRKVISDAGLDT